MNENWHFADSEKMQQRKNLALDFYNRILDPDEHPIVVTDVATFYDLYAGEDKEAINLIYNQYGIVVNNKHFKMAFWQFLDFLYKDGNF